MRLHMIGDWSPLAEAIQLAIAPVFLLTGVAGMLNALGVRLARVIDRARALEAKLEQLDGADARAKLEDEIESLATRGRIINWSTALMVICALLIGLTVIELFYSAGITGRLQLSSWVSITFLSGLVCFIMACVLYLAEILVASRSVRIGASR
ncbi:MAG TPA: DUF2721 domain-containing protein [Burkholderiaceae bacterium]|nr:DUF2721 domain-containing protein [Burkholderiaceae bacterium]